jgi:hypothetical protein
MPTLQNALYRHGVSIRDVVLASNFECINHRVPDRRNVIPTAHHGTIVNSPVRFALI